LSAKLQEILELLSDGKSHGLEDLQNKTKLNIKQTEAAVEFLTEYGFMETENGNRKVRISKAAERLFAQKADNS